MKRTAKRILSALLIAVMLISVVPVGALAVGGKNNGELETDTYVKGSSSVGTMLAETLDNAQNEYESDFESGAFISGLDLEGLKAKVNFSTQKDARLVVAVYAEDSGKMLTSGVKDVSAEETSVTVDINKASLPQYYRVKAFLIDADNMSALCSPYTDNEGLTGAEKTGDIIKFGSYPQSRVTDEAIIDGLDSQSLSWKSYNYYSGTGSWDDGNMKPSDYMKYADIVFNGNKYRAVTFSKYRPYWTGNTSSPSNTQQNDNGYYTGNVYYFKYEPLKWRVLDASTGLVVCDSVIDSQAYNNYFLSSNGEYYGDSGKNHYASDWENSSLRKWLNEDFYNTAFSKLQQDRIQTLTRENKSPCVSEYDSNPTSDKITLLSYWDALNTSYGFSSSNSTEDTARQRKGTDYAKCQGLHVNTSSNYGGTSWWWLRSPGSSDGATVVAYDGWACYIGVSFIDYGVVPAFKFKSGIQESSQETILTFADDPALCVEDGKSINLRFAMTKDGGNTLYEGWGKPAVTVGDKTVISVSNMTEEKSVYSVSIKGLKIGQSTLVVTDTKTGTSVSLLITVRDKYTKTYTYAIDKMKEFYPDNIFEKNIKTNIYNQHGIYVNNYSAKYNSNTGGYTVSFDAYNSQYITGAVDIFDKDGNWLGSKKIKQKSSISSIKDTANKGFHLITDPITGKMFTYEQDSFSEKTENISFEVPKGGYFTISNNFALSFGTFLYNSSDILLDGIKSVIGGAKDDKDIDVAELVKEEIEEDKTLKEEMRELVDKTLSKIINKQTDNYVDLSIEQKCKSISDTLLDVFNALKIDYKTAFSVALDVSESKLLKAFGPAGTVLNSCFAFAESTDMVVRVEELVKSINAEYTTVVSSLDNGYVNENGVSVITNGNIDKEAVLQTFRVSSSDVVEAILNPQNPYEQYELYNICFVKDDKCVQPNGKVTVKIPVPENMKGNSCKIYRREQNGKWTVLQAYRSGDYLWFETDHFSFYALVYDKIEPEIVKMPNKTDCVKGDSIDLDGMVLKLNGKEIKSGFMCKENLAYKVGKQSVTVLYGDSELTFDINVKKSYINSVSLADLTLNYKKSANLSPEISADEGAKYTVKYESSNPKVAAVDKNGKVTALKKGSAKITCTVTDSNGNTVSDTCNVTVKYSFGQWLIKILLFGWIWY